LSTFQERLDALERPKELWPQHINGDNYARISSQVYVPSVFGKPHPALSLTKQWRALLIRRMVLAALDGTSVQAMVDLFSCCANAISEGVPSFARALARVHGIPIPLLKATADTRTPVYMSRELAQLLSEAELVEFEAATYMQETDDAEERGQAGLWPIHCFRKAHRPVA
jgi:hypothetical protein